MMVSACPMSNVGLFATLRHSHPLIYFAVYIPHDHDIESLVMSCPRSQMSHTFQSLWHLWESLRYHKSPQWCQWCLCSCMLFNSALQVFSLLVTFEHVTCNRLFQAEAFCPESWRIAYGVEPATEDFRATRAGFFKTIILLQNIKFFCRQAGVIETLAPVLLKNPEHEKPQDRLECAAKGSCFARRWNWILFFFSRIYFLGFPLPGCVTTNSVFGQSQNTDQRIFEACQSFSYTKWIYVNMYIYIYISELCPIVKCSLFFCFFSKQNTFLGCQGPLSSVG